MSKAERDNAPRVFRGGSWVNYAEDCAVAFRGSGDYPQYRDLGLGFRVALSSVP